MLYGWLLLPHLCTPHAPITPIVTKAVASLVLLAVTVIAAIQTATKLDNPKGRLGMTYLKDIKVCVDCTFFGTPHGQRDRCIHPKLTTVDLVTGNAEFPYCHAERRTQLPNHCGDKATLFVLNREAESDRLERLKELEEVMREAPTL